uniref:Uncharacterized protein n=1 Tax=Tetranychus urticae TaxID=32264 RepID=T1JWD4_TETUR
MQLFSLHFTNLTINNAFNFLQIE